MLQGRKYNNNILTEIADSKPYKDKKIEDSTNDILLASASMGI